MSPLTRAPSAASRPLLAKLVIAVTGVVALATSRPPPWVATEERELRVALDERGEQRLLLTVEIADPFYAGLDTAEIDVVVVTDRAASDFSLEARSLTPDTLEVFGSDAPDFGAGALTVRPSLESPARAAVVLALTCADVELYERPESCFARAELTLARESERPLVASVTATANFSGGDSREPDETFSFELEALEP